MTEEVRITYKRKPGAAPNYPKESDLPADEGAYIAPCNNCEVWFLESDLYKTAEVICPHGGPKISQSISKDSYEFGENFVCQIHAGDEIALVFLCDDCKIRG